MLRIQPSLLRSSLVLSTLATITTVGIGACGPDDPLAQVAKVRSEYTVTLNSWHVVKPETAAESDLAEPATEPAADPAATEPASETTEPALEPPTETAPSKQTVLFDVLLAFNGDRALPGITLDVTQADPFEKEKDHRRHWIDTSKFVKGSLEAVTFELGGFDFVDGDVFSVDLLAFVPEQNRGEYREFAEAGR